MCCLGQPGSSGCWELWLRAGPVPGALGSPWGVQDCSAALHGLTMGSPLAPVHRRFDWGGLRRSCIQESSVVQEVSDVLQSCASILGSGSAQPGLAEDCVRAVKVTDLQQQHHF